MGQGRSGWKRGERRVVTPSSEQISRATFSSRSSRKPNAAITAKVLWSRFIILLDDEQSYLFITFVLCLRWVGTCQPRPSLLVIVCHMSFFFSFFFASHPCLVIFVSLMASVVCKRSWPRRWARFDLIQIPLHCHMYSFILCGCVLFSVRLKNEK